MSVISRMYRNELDIDFPRLWRPAIIVSGVIILAGVAGLLTSGLNLSIDFQGGTVWEIPASGYTADDAEAVLAEFDKADDTKIQVVSDPDGDELLKVQAEQADDIDESQAIASAFAEDAGIDVNDISTNTVGPSWGEQITRDAAKALVVFLVVVSLYISWQLEWRMAVSALTAVVHDILLTVGIYAIFQFPVTPATVISFLTILGYSLYDTIVVYDRVRENAARYDRAGTYTYTAIVRRSLNQVFMRSMNTTISSILPVGSILVIGGYIMGQDVMLEFALALFIGMIAGTYSSVFVAAPMVAKLKEREETYARIRRRATERGLLDVAEHIPVDFGAAAATASEPVGASVTASPAATATDNTTEAKAARYQREHPPRPRKQGRRR